MFPSPNGDVFVKSEHRKKEENKMAKFPSPNGDVFVKFETDYTIDVKEG